MTQQVSLFRLYCNTEVRMNVFFHVVKKKKKTINSLQGIAATVQVEYTEMFPQQTKANCN